jgi:Ca-activated chloride channel family protein
MAMILMLLALSAADPDYSRMGVVEDGVIVADLPLEHTSAEITVSGMYQVGVVRQIYGNPYERPIEAVYVFPLPENGAVSRMDMYIGDRHVAGDIQERSQAVRMYQEAIQAGQTAALLEQERPNIFTQTVGNILPGDSIVIEIEYTAPVAYESGTWELSFPMVVGPRFIPQGVADASRIAPPVVPEGTRAGYDIELSVLLDPGMPVRWLESENHEIVAEKQGILPLISLAPGETIPNRDFVLRYRTASDGIGAGFVAHNGELGGHFMLMLEPDAVVDRSLVAPKEMFFVIDCSGSMSGQPMDVARETVRRFVEGMNPGDSFQIMRFSETASSMSSRPMPNTPENVRAGVAYINSLSGQGGTMMIEGIRAAIGYPEDPDRMRYIVFLTDGYIGNESEILGELQSTVRDNTRLFSIGVGSSVNRYLIEGLAEEGMGSSVYVGYNEDPETAVAEIYRKINNPYLVGIELDWGGLQVADVQFGGTRDLYDGEPLVITGRFLQPGTGSVEISGTLGGRPWSREVEVTLPEEGEGSEAADRLWASRRLAALRRSGYSPELSASEREDLTETMIGISLDYRVLCEYTAFVAVDSERRTQGGIASTVEIPLNMPEGVSYQGVFGSPAPSSSSCGYRMNGAGGGSVGRSMIACESSADGEQWAYEPVEPAPVVRLVSVDDPLGARPSVFRSLMTELARELQTLLEDETGVTGTMILELTLDSSGRITGVVVLENTTGITRLGREARNLLAGRTVEGAGAGTATVEFSVE